MVEPGPPCLRTFTDREENHAYRPHILEVISQTSTLENLIRLADLSAAQPPQSNNHRLYSARTLALEAD